MPLPVSLGSWFEPGYTGRSCFGRLGSTDNTSPVNSGFFRCGFALTTARPQIPTLHVQHTSHFTLANADLEKLFAGIINIKHAGQIFGVLLPRLWVFPPFCLWRVFGRSAFSLLLSPILVMMMVPAALLRWI